MRNTHRDNPDNIFHTKEGRSTNPYRFSCGQDLCRPSIPSHPAPVNAALASTSTAEQPPPDPVDRSQGDMPYVPGSATKRPSNGQVTRVHPLPQTNSSSEAPAEDKDRYTKGSKSAMQGSDKESTDPFVREVGSVLARLWKRDHPELEPGNVERCNELPGASSSAINPSDTTTKGHKPPAHPVMLDKSDPRHVVPKELLDVPEGTFGLSADRKVKCVPCRKWFDAPLGFRNHLRDSTRHGAARRAARGIASSSILPSLERSSSPSDGASNSSTVGKRRVDGAQAGQDKRCETCRITFKDSTALQRHKAQSVAAHPTYCQFCSVEYVDQGAYRDVSNELSASLMCRYATVQMTSSRVHHTTNSTLRQANTADPATDEIWHQSPQALQTLRSLPMGRLLFRSTH